MTGTRSPRSGPPDPDGARAELARRLTSLRRRAGLSIRGLAQTVGVPPGTLGGYFSGEHLPRVGEKGRLVRLVEACGVPLEELGEWRELIDRVYALTGPVGEVPLVTTIRPPIERLNREPRQRGRTRLLGELGRAVTDLDGPRVHVLHGLGGVGKSFVALSLAHWAASRGVVTWWVSAGEKATVSAGMRALAVELGARPHQIEMGGAADLVWRLLGGYRKPWLLIIDNADDPPRDLLSPEGPVSDGAGWLRPPTGRHGAVLITSRDGTSRTWGTASWLRLHRLEPLGDRDGAAVLCESAGPEAGTPAEALELAARLGGLPLALRLAGLHLRQARRLPDGLTWRGMAATFTQYSRELDRGRHGELLESAAAGGPVRSRPERTWELSLDALDARDLGDARPLLRLLACLAAAPIPYGVLLAPDVLGSSALFSGPMTGPRLWALLQALDGLGLVELEAGTVVLHPVLRAVAGRHPDVTGNAAAYAALLTALFTRAVTGLYPSDPGTWPVFRAVAVHCPSASALLAELGAGAPAPPGILVPGLLAAQYLRASGRLPEAAPAYTALLDRGRVLLGERHPDVMAAQQGLGRVLYAMGRWEQADRLLTELWELRRESLGPDHPDTLTTRHYLGRLRLDAGDPRLALGILEEVVEARRRTLGHEAGPTLSTTANLADALRALGRTGEAAEMLDFVVKTRTATLGAQFPATIAARVRLATVWRDDGSITARHAEVEALAADALSALGPLHPRTLAAEQLLGESLMKRGRTTAALDLLGRVAAGRAKILGPGHPATAVTRRLVRELRASL